jgi:hypothetical protein
MKLVTPQLEQGRFIPFGAILGQCRDAQLLVPEGMKRNVMRNELDAYFIQHIRKAIGNGKYVTACWCDGFWRRRDINSQTPSPMYASA